MSVPEMIQLIFATMTLPVAFAFIWLFARDPWWRTRFGWSLMLIAVAILLYSMSAILFRLFGPDYWGRPILLPVSSGMTFVAMLLRTIVLMQVQRSERRQRLL